MSVQDREAGNMLQAVAKAGATVLERTPFAIDDAQDSSENEDDRDKEEGEEGENEDDEGDDDDEEEEDEDEDKDEDEDEEDDEDKDEDEDEEDDEANEDDEVLDEVDAFLEAHDSGLTEADKEIAKRAFLFLSVVQGAHSPLIELQTAQPLK